MNHIVLIFMTSADPQTMALIQKIFKYICPIILALALGFATLLAVRFGFAIAHDPENKAKYIRNLVWQVGGLIILVLASTIGTILVNVLNNVSS